MTKYHYRYVTKCLALGKNFKFTTSCRDKWLSHVCGKNVSNITLKGHYSAARQSKSSGHIQTLLNKNISFSLKCQRKKTPIYCETAFHLHAHVDTCVNAGF